MIKTIFTIFLPRVQHKFNYTQIIRYMERMNLDILRKVKSEEDGNPCIAKEFQ